MSITKWYFLVPQITKPAADNIVASYNIKHWLVDSIGKQKIIFHFFFQFSTCSGLAEHSTHFSYLFKHPVSVEHILKVEHNFVLTWMQTSVQTRALAVCLPSMSVNFHLLSSWSPTLIHTLPFISNASCRLLTSLSIHFWLLSLGTIPRHAWLCVWEWTYTLKPQAYTLTDSWAICRRRVSLSDTCEDVDLSMFLSSLFLEKQLLGGLIYWTEYNVEDTSFIPVI